MEPFLEIAAANRRCARTIIRSLRLEEIWRSVGADPHPVGSLRTGLLMSHLDIDYHIYSDPLRLSESFAAIARIAEHPRIRRMTYDDLREAPDRCLEWHVWYADEEERLWQIDMTHMAPDNPYAGYFERVADRIAAALTDETRTTILRLKYETSADGEKVPGIACCQAVLRDGVRTRAEFDRWRAAHPLSGILEWMP